MTRWDLKIAAAQTSKPNERTRLGWLILYYLERRWRHPRRCPHNCSFAGGHEHDCGLAKAADFLDSNVGARLSVWQFLRKSTASRSLPARGRPRSRPIHKRPPTSPSRSWIGRTRCPRRSGSDSSSVARRPRLRRQNWSALRWKRHCWTKSNSDEPTWSCWRLSLDSEVAPDRRSPGCLCFDHSFCLWSLFEKGIEGTIFLDSKVTVAEWRSQANSLDFDLTLRIFCSRNRRRFTMNQRVS